MTGDHRDSTARRPRDAGRRRIRRGRVAHLALGVVLGAALFAAPALAAGGGGGHGGGHGSSAASAGDRPDKETVLPRTEADSVTGDYMQLSVMWLPVLQNRRSRYEAFTIRLTPHPDRRVLACFKAPWAHEAVMMALNEQPVSVQDKAHLDAAALKERLLARIATQVGPGLFTDVTLGSGIVEVDPEAQRLSEMCR
ncbi:hypothetical protein [Roseospira visakhapatnamensis]|uniref:Uncharacterized protein n=1 Tax=Roseospira visakhapatnamensis TaxID=390880 RepID=A0A7W6W8C4_9PROT|nr:hypothetical protein [Roseospira visakhapatnamensis]MBB4264709.1 hypothetical protein [Roseospira visakhapatnamensis]